MIFCDDPLANEPGAETLGQSSVASMYEYLLRHHTVGYGMVKWLRTPPPLWKDVVGLHFKKNARKMLETVSKWERLPPPPSRGSNPRGDSMARSEFLGSMGAAENMSALRAKLQTALQSAGFLTS
jgi:hypothetical protein